MLIKFDGIKKTFYMGGTEIKALDEISLEIQEGEFVAIMGPSGSGKTTFLGILGLLSRQTAGNYFLDNQNTQNLSDEGLAKLRNSKIGFVFQNFNLLPRFTAQENVELPLIYAGLNRKERAVRSLKLLEEVGLVDRGNHSPNQLSGGEQQRVAIARALVNESPILLADELTGNLDSKTGAEIMKLLVDINGKGTTIVMITHDAGIAGYAHRLITLKDGRIHSEEKGV
jgi:putative ABC transport system ATP-binding protein